MSLIQPVSQMQVTSHSSS